MIGKVRGKMTFKLYIDGQLKDGAYIQNYCVHLNEDYTMNQLVEFLRAQGFERFKTKDMGILVKI